MYDDCNACEGKGVIPQVVLDSVTAFGERHSRERAQEYIAALRWCGDHYSFMCGGLYVGIEVDGHLHT